MEHLGTKILETPRLILRPFRPEDAEPMYRNWASQEEVTRFLTWPTYENVDSAHGFIRFMGEQYPNRDYYQWAMELRSLGEPIGSISGVRVFPETESVEIGYCIGSAWWGQGLMPEALGEVLRFFFEEVGVNCVRACHDPRNPNSGRVMRKCGMRRDGLRRAASRNNQGVCDEVWYSLLRSEFEHRRDDPGAVWDELYARARAVQNDRRVSPFIDAGGVAAALLTKDGNIYTGVCIDTASTLGMCAERNAIANMLTHGESRIDKLAAVMPDGSVGAPCGACREYMMQLDAESGDIEILLDRKERRTVRLRELLPCWWGESRFAES